MNSTPTSPTSSRWRRSSTHHKRSSTNNSIPTTPTASHFRRSSQNNYNSSPTHHRRKSSSIHSLQQDSPLDRSLSNSQFLQSGGVGGAGDLGESLADELAEAWDDEDEGDEGVVDEEYEGDQGGEYGPDKTNMRRDDNPTINGNDITSPTRQRHRSNSSTSNKSLTSDRTRRKAARLRQNSKSESTIPSSTLDTPSPAAAKSKSSTRPQRQRTRDKYDGSDYGELSDSEISTDLPPGLKAAIADVEAVTAQSLHQQSQTGDPFFDHSTQKRRQTSSTSSSTIQPPQQSQPLAHIPEQPDSDSTSSNPVDRLLNELHTLHPQSTLETSTTRLITSHTALAMHITHQTRALQSLTYSLLSPLSPPPDPSQIDALLPLIAASLSSTPQPSVQALQDLVRLSASSRDVIGTLGALSDSLHMSREITGTAARRLRSAREVAGELRAEWERGEMGKRWIEEGGWEGRLKGSEGARVCRDGVGGFEEVCRGWRERLVREEQGMVCESAAGAG